MEIKDFKKITGILECYESKDGINWVEVFKKKNLITSVGDQNIAQLLIGSSSGYPMGFFAVGSGSSVAARSDTIVEGEYERFAIDVQTVDAITGGFEVVNTLNLNPAEGNGTIKKVGLIGHGPTTTLLNYNPLDPDESTHEWKLLNYSDVLLSSGGKVKDATISIKFIWRIIFTN